MTKALSYKIKHITDGPKTSAFEFLEAAGHACNHLQKERSNRQWYKNKLLSADPREMDEKEISAHKLKLHKEEVREQNNIALSKLISSMADYTYRLENALNDVCNQLDKCAWKLDHAKKDILSLKEALESTHQAFELASNLLVAKLPVPTETKLGETLQIDANYLQEVLTYFQRNAVDFSFEYIPLSKQKN